MESRVLKYSENEEESKLSRSTRNAELYKEINQTEIEDFNVNSNMQVIETNGSTIDVDRLRDMLDKKYRENPRSKSIGDAKEEEIPKINLDETREYDINAILNQAKEEKEEDYEIDRLKKLRNTQVDILNGLNIEGSTNNEAKAVSKPEGEKLRELIDTINLRNVVNQEKEVNPLDILTDLKGNDDTVVMGAMSDDLKTDTKEAVDLKKIVNEKKDEVKEKKEEQTFFTETSQLKKTDFEDFKELKDDVDSSKWVIIILIIIVVLAFIVGAVFLLNKFLNWGLF